MMKRYQLSGDRMFPAEEGSWSWYADAAAEIERLRRELAEASRREFAKGAEIQSLQDGKANLQRELDDARGLLRTIHAVGYFRKEIDAYLTRTDQPSDAIPQAPPYPPPRDVTGRTPPPPPPKARR